MKAIKRTVAALLATLMLATSTSFTLAAENYSDAEAVAVAKVNAAGVMTGTDNGFEPSKTLTRAEAAAIMVRMKGISKATVDQNAGQTLFTDVAASNWASGYINVASNYGIIKGVGANMFAPDKEVTVAEFYTMAIRALGAGKLVDSEGAWPTNYVNFAIENDLAEDVAQIYTATATRITAAIIAANTLEAPMWEKSQVKSNGEITWEAKDKTIIESVLKFTTTGLDSDKKVIKLSETITEISKKDNTVNKTIKVAENCNLDEIKVGMTYEYWLDKDGKVAGFWIPASLDKVDFTEIKKAYVAGQSGKTGTITLIVNGKEVEYDVKKDLAVADVYENEVKTTSELTTALGKKDNIRGIAYLDDDDVITKFYITNFKTVAVVDEATEKKVTVKSGSDYVGTLRNSAISLTVKDKEYFLTKDGKAIDFTDLKEDDVIKFYEVGSDKLVAEVIEPAVSGKITAKKSGTVKIDGKTYDLALSSADEAKLALKDEVTLYLNDAGKVILAVKDEEATPDYGYIASVRNVTGKYDSTKEIKLLLPNGELTDAMEIDLDETKEEFTSAWNFEGITLGAMIHFEIGNNNKVIVKNVTKPEYKKVAVKSGDDKVVLDVTNKNIKIVSVKTGTTDVLTTLYYVTKDTKVLKLKEDKDYSYKYEEVEVEDLDDLDFNLTKDSFVCGIDDDTKEVEVLYINTLTNIKRTTEASFAFITKVWDEEDEDEKAVKVIDVILQDGSTDTFTVNKDTTGAGSSYANVVAGTYWDMAAKNGVVLEMKKNTTKEGDDYLGTFDVTENKYLFKQLTSSRYQLTSTGASAADKELVVADDVLVLKANKAADADKWTVADLESLETYSTTDEVTNDKTLDTLVSVLTYTEEAGDEAEAKLIIYYVNEK